ncbi:MULTISPECIES: hypothetical protein [Actinomycetes]|uniref:hypothetical protein n=1 Tax=Actinomycetes TaxID=1760 RepID=UPI00382774B5
MLWLLAVSLLAATTGAEYGQAGGLAASRIAAHWKVSAESVIVLATVPLIILPSSARPVSVIAPAVASATLRLGGARNLRDRLGLQWVVKLVPDLAPGRISEPMLGYATFWGSWTVWGAILTAALSLVVTFAGIGASVLLHEDF